VEEQLSSAAASEGESAIIQSQFDQMKKRQRLVTLVGIVKINFFYIFFTKSKKESV
jgi:hypothetical protein